MVKGATRVWLGGLAIVLAALLVAALSNGVTAGSKDTQKGYLGVYMQELDKEVREGLDLDVSSGVLISGVEDDGPAALAGMEDGDVIVEFDGKKVGDPNDLRELAQNTEPGDKVKVVVIRDGEKKTLELTVGEWPDEITWMNYGDLHIDRDSFKDLGSVFQAFSPRPRLGVEVTELSEDLAPYFKTKAGAGVLVLKVREESVAEEAGIRAGDVITKVGDEDVSTVGQLQESLEDFEEGDEVPILMVRKGKKKTVTATMDDAGNTFLWSGQPNEFRYHVQKMPQMQKYHMRSPNVKMFVGDDDIHKEIEDLKSELQEMKKEIEKLKK